MPLVNNLPLILFAESDPASLMFLAKTLRSNEMSFTVADSGEEVMTLVRDSRPRVVILDLALPGLPARDIIMACTQDYPETKIVIVSQDSDPETISDFMNRGAVDYLSKPFESQRVLNTVLNVLKMQDLELTQRSMAESGNRTSISNNFDLFVGNSYVTIGLLKKAETFAKRNFPVFIRGETGTGKRLLARLIHKESGNPRQFILINAHGMSDEDFIRILSNTSQNMDTGTLFINDIDHLSMDVQVYLAQWLRDQKYSYPFNTGYPNQAEIQPKVYVRWLFGASQKLEPMVNKDQFRKDLYFLLTANTINIPPLRENTDEIPVLLERFLTVNAQRLGKPVPNYPKELISLLKSYHFPGNAGELAAMTESAMAFHQNRMLSCARFAQLIEEKRENSVFLPMDPLTFQNMVMRIQPLPTLKQAKNMLLAEAMRRSDNNQSSAAKLLGITRQAINTQLNKKNEENASSSDSLSDDSRAVEDASQANVLK